MKFHQPDINKRTLIRWKVYFDRSRMYIGYIYFREEEQRNLSRSNPVMMEMLNELKELNKKIELFETEKTNKKAL